VNYGSVQEPKIFDSLLNVQVVFHLASTNLLSSVRNPQNDLEVNGVGTLNLLNAVKQFNRNIVVVFASSGSVYGEPLLDPQTESHLLNPVSPYGISKLAAEKYLEYYYREFGLNTVILRYYNIVGSRQNYNDEGGVVPIFVKRMLQGYPLVVEGDGFQERVFTDVRDVVDATIAASKCRNAYGSAFNIATNEVNTINALAEKVLAFSDKKLEVRYTRPRIGDIHSFHPSIKHAKTVLGYNPKYSLDDSLKSVVEWMRRELAL
jgi:UDP-glucose 4-epimerase